MRERLIELINKSGVSFCNFPDKNYEEECKSNLADYLLANGVILAPMPMTEKLREELTDYVHERCVDEL